MPSVAGRANESARSSRRRARRRDEGEGGVRGGGGEGGGSLSELSQQPVDSRGRGVEVTTHSSHPLSAFPTSVPPSSHPPTPPPPGSFPFPLSAPVGFPPCPPLLFPSLLQSFTPRLYVYRSSLCVCDLCLPPLLLSHS